MRLSQMRFNMINVAGKKIVTRELRIVRDMYMFLQAETRPM